MPKVFISYIRENQKLVDKLVRDLKKNNVEVWLDRDELNPGCRWQDAIRKAIAEGDYFIACFSSEYVNRVKTYMNEELTIAIDELRQRPTDIAWFIPTRLTACEIPDRNIGGGETLRSIQWVDLFEDWDQGIKRILSVIILSLPLRSDPVSNLSDEDAKKMLVEKHLFDINWHWMGIGIQHQYELHKHNGILVIIDKSTKLMWQRFCSGQEMTFLEGLGYVRELNRKEYSSYTNWRLPTLEEVIALLEPKTNGYINKIFKDRNRAIWTCDSQNDSISWAVYIPYGHCSRPSKMATYYIRAVRSF